MTFTIREENDDGEEQLYEQKETLPGEKTNFRLDENSQLFVGGYSDFQMPDSIKQSAFEGEIEGLKIGDSEVGLWNFVDGQNNNLGALERDRLVAKEAKYTGYRFGGNGYVVLDAQPFNFKHRSHINFKFKASRDSLNGLLFLVGNENHYISLELRNGNIVFQLKLGQTSEVLEILSEGEFNNDEWHEVSATRDGAEGRLIVDGMELYKSTIYTSDSAYRNPDKMYFGGYPERLFVPGVQTRNFDGCIDDVHIDSTPLDLSRNIESHDVLPGCPNKFSSVVGFAQDKFGYIKMRNLTIPNKLNVNLKFKTVQSNGVIFYGMSNDQSATVSLALVDGILVFRSSKFELNSENQRFDDGNWHVVTVTHDSRQLKISVDDAYENVSREAPPPLYVTFGEIYFGGVPRGFSPARGAIANDAYFVGCIQDVSVNTNVINFASSTDKQNAILNTCPRDIVAYNPQDAFVYYPNGHQEKPKRVEEDFDVRFSEKDNEIPDEKTAKEGDDKATRPGDRRPDQSWDGTPDQTREPTDKPKDRKPDQSTDKSRDGTPDQPKDRRPDKRPIEETTTTPTPIQPLAPIITTESTTTTTRRPYTEDEKHRNCVLPAIPNYDVDFESGYRFGTKTSSFIEFKPHTTATKTSYNFSLTFRTDKQNGLLFYGADERHTDFLAVYLKDGYVNHHFRCRNSEIKLTSVNQFDNNEWHTISFTRDRRSFGLSEFERNENILKELKDLKCPGMDLSTNYFVGGASEKVIEDVELNLQLNGNEKGFLTENAFFGCIKDVQLNSEPLEISGGISEEVLPCSDQIEKGVFFGKSGGFVTLYKKFRVGTDLTISMDIKPRNVTGILTSVHGKKSFFIVEMIDGNIHFSVDSGDGPRHVKFEPDPDRSLCDGEWHTVTVIKSRFILSVNVGELKEDGRNFRNFRDLSDQFWYLSDRFWGLK